MTDSAPFQVNEGYTTESSIEKTRSRLITSFEEGLTIPISFRLLQLQRLRQYVISKEKQIQSCLFSDLGRSPHETTLISMYPMLLDLDYFLHANMLHELSKPKKVGSLVQGLPIGLTYEHQMPKGIVLIYAPSNFPVSLAIKPITAAIAAGNVVVLKPSEHTPESEQFLSTLSSVLDPRIFGVITGGVETAKLLMEYQWKHVLFTGSSLVGKQIMKAASKFLTPVTLELGGMNPAFILKDVNLKNCVRSVIQGRFLNTGQVCLAPNYCFVEEEIMDDFCNLAVKYSDEFFNSDPKTSYNFGRLAPHQFDTVKGMLEMSDGTVLSGGNTDKEDKFIAPTLIRTTLADRIITEQPEIFGPILLIISIKSIDQGINHLKQKPEPLALYVYGHDKQKTNHILRKTQSGSVGINEAVVQTTLNNSYLMGFGNSGMGGGVGSSKGFHTFSHSRVVMDASQLTSILLRGNDLKPILTNEHSKSMFFMALGVENRPRILRWFWNAGKSTIRLLWCTIKVVAVVQLVRTIVFKT